MVKAIVPGHGGEQRAVFVYQIDSYRYWERELGRNDFVYGQFGENFTVEGLADDEVCIGDRYRIGSRRLRGHPTSRHLLPRRDPHERPAHPRVARLTPPPRLLLPRARRGRGTGGRRDHQARLGPRADAVAEVDALLYLPGHPRQQLLRALRIPALSPGWQASFRALLDEEPGSGNAGLVGDEPTSRLAGLPSADCHRNHPRERLGDLHPPRGPGGRGTTGARPGQYLTRARSARPAAAGAAPQLLPLRAARSAAITGSPSSANRDGAVSGYLHTRLAVGDQLDIASTPWHLHPRRDACARAADQRRDRCHPGPRHAPGAGERSTPTERSGGCTVHATAASTRSPPRPRPSSLCSRTHAARVYYSRPGPDEVEGRDFDAAGRLTGSSARRARTTRATPRHTCAGPTPFMDEISAGLAAMGIDASRIHTEPFGPARPSTPGIAATPAQGTPPAGRQSRKRPHDRVRPQQPRDPAGAATTATCSNSPRHATCPSAGRAAPASAIPARPRSSPATSHYSPDPVEPPADGSALICCSQPRDDLVLDL